MTEESSANRGAWVRKHAVAVFVAGTLLWSWGFWAPLFWLVPPGGVTKGPSALAGVFVGLGLLGPLVNGLLWTRVCDGKAGWKALGARLTDIRVGWWWGALLIIPGLTAVVPLVRLALGVPLDLGVLAGLLLPGLALGMVSGSIEEFGWRGFLLPRLLGRHSPVVATLLLGLVWGGLWHGYADYFGLADRGWIAVPLIVLLGPVLLTSWSFVLTAVYRRTRGSLAVSILMHASISSSALILGQKYASFGEELGWTAASVAVAAAGAWLVWRSWGRE